MQSRAFLAAAVTLPPAAGQADGQSRCTMHRWPVQLGGELWWPAGQQNCAHCARVHRRRRRRCTMPAVVPYTDHRDVIEMVQAALSQTVAVSQTSFVPPSRAPGYRDRGPSGRPNFPAQARHAPQSTTPAAGRRPARRRRGEGRVCLAWAAGRPRTAARGGQGAARRAPRASYSAQTRGHDAAE